MTDVLVVGGGLGGAAAAVRLASQGFKVRLIDRAHFPRRKACGEGLFPRGVEELDRLELLEPVMKSARVLDSLRLEAGGVSVEGRLDTGTYPALGVRRELLDALLIQRARDAGVDVRTGITAVDLIPDGRDHYAVRTTDGDMTAGLVLLADGLQSRLRRVAGLDVKGTRQRYGISAHFRVPEHVSSRVQIHLHPGHEFYVTPVSHDVVNVALLFDKNYMGMRVANERPAFLSLAMQSGVVPASAVPADRPLATGPFPSSARRLWKGNLLLAGDAAGFFDGISGEGMSLALVSSQLAADAASSYLQSGGTDGFASYERGRRKLLRNSNLIGRISLFLAAHPGLARRALRNMNSHPGTFDKVLSANAGLTSLSAFKPRDLACLVFGI